MRGPVYYAILFALLGALVVVLVLLIRKRRRDDAVIRAYQEKMDKLRAERQAEEERKQPNWRFYEEPREEQHIPKYAAGDDMDRLNRNRSYQRESYGPLALAGLGLLCATVFFLHSTSGTPTPTVTQPSTEKVFNGPQTTDKLSMEILSTETNQSRTKVYVTLGYENLSTVSCYNIVTTVTLLYDGTAVDTVEHTLSTVPGGTTTEEIVTLTIPTEHQNDAYRVNAHVQYKWKIT